MAKQYKNAVYKKKYSKKRRKLKSRLEWGKMGSKGKERAERKWELIYN
jgi:hypothetical protein